jgi:L-seryl-tRNA(Ser) seleniumtransferase
MRAGGVRLVEVGTTNRTRLSDFEEAITSETAMILRVHTSNYRIMGFAEEAELADLVELGRRRGVIVADDLGSGALLTLDVFAGEPTVAESLRAGVDVVCFSGDKLLGGPQAGILLGRAEVIDALRRHPVARALRLDKMTLAALEATLQLYSDPAAALRAIPTLRHLSRTPEETAALAAELQRAIEQRCADGFILEVEETNARAGGGSLPMKDIPSHAVRIRLGGATITALEAALRRAPTPVVARVAQDSIYLDVLALGDDEIELVAESLSWAAAQTVGAIGDAQRCGPREPDSMDPGEPTAPAHGRRPGDAPRPTRGPTADA